ncbi:MAG TPA: hypothetical protein V6C57_13130 [Coleofasciculaceae cyanobacterium]
MFEPTSRYYGLETATFTNADQQNFAYIRRRFLPQGQNLSLLVEVTVTEGDRLDLIASRTLGSSEQFWQICDANNAMNPADLTTEPGDRLRVPLPPISLF